MLYVLHVTGMQKRRVNFSEGDFREAFRMFLAYRRAMQSECALWFGSRGDWTRLYATANYSHELTEPYR